MSDSDELAAPPAPLSTPTSQWGFFIVLIGLCVFTLGAGVRVGRQMALAANIDDFERTSGEVALSELVERGGRDYVSARVVVRYEVDGETLELETSGNDGRADPAKSAQAFLGRYPVGVRVPVYYDPRAPHRASLTTTVRYSADLGFAIGLLAVTLAFGAWLAVRRRRTAAGAPND